jgi:DNA repair protein RecO
MQKTLALVLKKQNIGETDRILTIFSPTLGKKRVVVRAVRKPLSKLAGHVDTLMLSQLILTDDTDLPKVTSAVLIEAFELMRGSLVAVDQAFSISRIIERAIVEDIPQQRVFQLTLDAFARINSEQKWAAVWLSFLQELTQALGLGVTNFNCAYCQKPIQGAARWVIGDRQFHCHDCPVPTATHIRVSEGGVKLTKLLQAHPFSVIRSIRFSDTVAKEVEEVFLREITEWFNKPWHSYSSLRK